MTTTVFENLYKKTNTGAIQIWQIRVEGNVIHTVYGQLGGKLQETSNTIKEGKNVGKVNGTTPEGQAIAEAAAKYEHQIKKGYSKTLDDAEAGGVSEVIEGGIFPMLAPSKIYPAFKHKLTFPVYVQKSMTDLV